MSNGYRGFYLIPFQNNSFDKMYDRVGSEAFVYWHGQIMLTGLMWYDHKTCEELSFT